MGKSAMFQRKLIFCSLLADAIPYLAPFTIAALPLEAELLRGPVERFLIFIFIASGWRAFRFVLDNIFRGTAAISQYVTILALGLSTLILLQVLKTRIEAPVFYIILSVLLALLLEDYFKRKGNAGFALAANFLAAASISLSGFALLGLVINVATIMFCSAIGALSAAHLLTKFAVQGIITLEGAPERDGRFTRLRKFFHQRHIYSLIYSLALTGAPLLIGGIVVLEYLPGHFMLIFLMLLVIAPLVSRANRSLASDMERERLFLDTSGIYLIFIVSIITLRAFI